SAYLNELFAKNSFQTAVLELRDLLRMQNLLQDWSPKLDAYRDLLLQKQGIRSKQEELVKQNSIGKQAEQLQRERDQLAQRLAQIENDENYIALADEETRALYTRVENGQQTIARMKAAGQNTVGLESRLNMFGGILLWRAAQEYP